MDHAGDDAHDSTKLMGSNWTEGDASVLDVVSPGTQIGRYVVAKHIGTGGMGSVYRAHDPRLERDVAVKLLKPGKGSAENRAGRMLREAQALAKLAHPNIVAVHDTDVHDGRVYIAMELVDGITLREWAREGRSVDEILSAYVSAARGLAAAHDAGIVHRDFKPANAMRGVDGRVRVLDFGLARAGSHDTSEPDASPDGAAAPMTRTGTVMGTPAYMAPEQHAAQPATAAADQFAWCVATYEALYGEHPFGGDTAAELASRATAGAVRPAPPKAAVPEWVRAALLRGLRPEPADRFDSMQELIAELTKERGARRRMGRFAVVGAALIAAGVAVGYVGWGGSERAGVGPCSGVAGMLDEEWNDDVREELRARAPSPEIGAALVERIDAYADSWLDQRSTVCSERDEAHAERVQCLDRARFGFGQVVLALTEAEPGALANTDRLVGALPALSDCARPAGAFGWITKPVDAAAAAEREHVLEQAQRAETLTAAGRQEEAGAIARELIDGLDQLRDPLARARVGKYAAQLTRDPARREVLLRGAIRDAIKVRDEVWVVNAYLDLLIALADQEKWADLAREGDTAEAHVERMIQFVEGWPGSEQWASLMPGQLENLRGVFEQRQEHHAAAIPHFRRAVEHWEAVTDSHPDRVSSALNNLGEVLISTGQYAAAVEALDRAIQIADAADGFDPIWRATMRANRANARMQAGRADRALPDYAKALELAGKSAYSATVAFHLAELYTARGQLDAAAQFLGRARAAWTKSLPPEHASIHLLGYAECNIARVDGRLTDAIASCEAALAGLIGADASREQIADVRVALAEAYVATRRYADARRELGDATTAYAETTGLHTAKVARAQAVLGRVLLLDADADADRALGEALDTFAAVWGDEHPHAVAALVDRATLWVRNGRAADARELAERAVKISDGPGGMVPAAEADRARALLAELAP